MLRKYGVEQAFLFGSAARGDMQNDSDIDILFRFPKSMHHETYADNFFALEEALRELLKRDVQLVAEETLRNPYLIQTIERDKIPLL